MRGTIPLQHSFILFGVVILLHIVSASAQSRSSALSSSGEMLPAPTGACAIGTAIFPLSDRTRSVPLAMGSAPSRELMIQVWYPAASSVSTSPAPYLPDPGLLKAMKQEQYLDLSAEILDRWDTLKTHAVLDAPIATHPAKMPLLLFSPGYGVSRVTYTVLLEELASRGYIVIAVDHPYCGLSVLPDGRVLTFTAGKRGEETVPARVEAMGQDASFVLNALQSKRGDLARFQSHIDSKRVGIFGHSLGGGAALEIGRTDARFRACADLDGDAWGRVEQEGVKRPYMVLLNEPGEPIKIPAEMRKQRDDQWAAILSKQKTPAFVVKIHDMSHFSFSDIPFVTPREFLQKQGANLSPRRGAEILSDLLVGFFSKYLTGDQGRTMQEIIKLYPEVKWEKFER